MSGRTVAFLVCSFAVVLLCCAPSLAGSVGLSWAPSASATGYRVFYGPSENNYYATPLYDGPATQTTINNGALSGCTTWYFAVVAYNSAGASGYSNSVHGWTRPQVGSVGPTEVAQGTLAPLTVRGSSFEPGASVEFESAGSFIENQGGNCDAQCNCEIDLLATVEPTAPGTRPAEVGSFTVTVSNPSGLSGTRSQAFEITMDPARFDVNRSDTTTRDRLDGKDLVWLSRLVGSHENDATYDPDFDFDGDGWIDGRELSYLVTHNFGGCWNGDDWSVAACPNALQQGG